MFTKIARKKPVYSWHTFRYLAVADFNGEGNGNSLQYSCLENPMDRGAWWATIHGVSKSRTRLSDFCVCVCVCVCAQTLNSSNMVQDREAPVKGLSDTLSSLFQTPKDWKITEGKKLQSFRKIIFYRSTSSPDRTWTKIDINLPALSYTLLFKLNKRLKHPRIRANATVWVWSLSSLGK